MKKVSSIFLCLTLFVLGITVDAASFELTTIAWVTGDTPDNLDLAYVSALEEALELEAYDLVIISENVIWCF